MFKFKNKELSVTEKLIKRRESSIKAIVRHNEMLVDISNEAEYEIAKHEEEIEILEKLVN